MSVNSHAVRMELFKKYENFADLVATKYLMRLPRSIPRKDIENTARIALWEMTNRIKPNTPHKKIRAFIKLRVSGSIGDFMRNEVDHLKRTQRAVVKEEIEKQKKEENYSFTAGERMSLVSFDDIADTKFEPKYFIDPLKDLANTRYCSLLIKCLSNRERQVIDMFFFKGKKLMEIAKLFKCTEGRISQIKTRAIGKMKKRARVIELQETQ